MAQSGDTISQSVGHDVSHSQSIFAILKAFQSSQVQWLPFNSRSRNHQFWNLFFGWITACTLFRSEQLALPRFGGLIEFLDLHFILQELLLTKSHSLPMNPVWELTPGKLKCSEADSFQPSYAKGSPERQEITKALAKLKASLPVQIPLIVGNSVSSGFRQCLMHCEVLTNMF